MKFSKRKNVYAKSNNNFLFLLTYNLPSFSNNKEYFLMLKNNKVNVRYGPSLKSPVKFVYNKILLPVKIIDKRYI